MTIKSLRTKMQEAQTVEELALLMAEFYTFTKASNRTAKQIAIVYHKRMKELTSGTNRR